MRQRRRLGTGTDLVACQPSDATLPSVASNCCLGVAAICGRGHVLDEPDPLHKVWWCSEYAEIWVVVSMVWRGIMAEAKTEHTTPKRPARWMELPLYEGKGHAALEAATLLFVVLAYGPLDRSH